MEMYNNNYTVTPHSQYYQEKENFEPEKKENELETKIKNNNNENKKNKILGIFTQTLAKEKSEPHPDLLLHAVWVGAEMDGMSLLKQTKCLRKEYKKLAKKDATILTTISQLYEKAAEKFIEEGKVKKAFKARSIAAKKIQFTSDHPLYHMNKAIAKGTKRQPDPYFGAFFSNLDAGALKMGNMRAFSRKMNQGKKNYFVFKIGHHSRQKLESSIALIKNNQEIFKSALPKRLKGTHITQTKQYFMGKNNKGEFSNGYGIAIEKEDSPVSFMEKKENAWGKKGNAWEINLSGLARVVIGNSPGVGCLYNNVTVELDANLPDGKGLEIMHQLFTMLGLGPIACPKRNEDIERIKAAQLFRTFFPKEALDIERTSEFYEMPIEALKAKIEELVPEMEDIFHKYLVESPELLKEEEIYPGKKAWSVSDLSNQMREAGAYGLFASLSSKNSYDAADTIILMLKNGALSTQDRFEAGLFKYGMSSEEDLKSGGGDYVFTRLCTEKMQLNLKNFSSDVIMLFDLDAVNHGSYGYHEDYWGAKNSSYLWFGSYADRSNLIDLAKKLTPINGKNEIMIKNRIKPEYIRGILVESKIAKEVIKEKLKKAGIKSFNGKSLDNFIHIATNKPAQRELWDV